MYKLKTKLSRYVLVSSFAIFAFCLLYFSYDLGSRAIYTRGEGREGLVVKSMIEQHNFVLPLRGGIDIPSKPPMFHWLSVLTFKVSGHLDGFALRFPSALAASGTILLIFLFSNFYYNTKVAAFAALILGTAFEFSRNASNARVDMCFTFFVSGALISGFLIIKMWNGNLRAVWWHQLLLVCFLAGGILSKGPTGLILPFLVFSIYFFLANYADLRKSLLSLPWMLIFILLFASTFLAGIWYWLAYLEQGRDFLNTQIFKENLARIVPGEGKELGHSKPFYYAPLYMLAGFMPWSLFIPIVIAPFYHSRLNILHEGNRDKLFLFVWVLVFLVAVTFSNSKRIVYFLPAYPALAVLFSLSLRNLKCDSFTRFYLIIFGALAFIFLSLVILLVSSGSHFIKFIQFISPALVPRLEALVSTYNYIFLSSGFFMSTLISLALVVLAIIFFYQRKFNKGLALLGLTCLLTYFSVCHWILPIDSQFKDARKFVSKVEAIVEPDDVITSYNHDLYSARFYFHRPIAVTYSIESLKAREANYVLATFDQVSEVLNAIPGGKVIASSIERAADGQSSLVLINFDNNQ